jgi:hypothetical protein
VIPENHKEADQEHIGRAASSAGKKTRDSFSRSSLKKALSLKEKKTGTAYRCSIKTGHFYFGLTHVRKQLAFQG